MYQQGVGWLWGRALVMSCDKKLRGCRRKKRTFCGNRYGKKQKKDVELECEEIAGENKNEEDIIELPSTSQKASATPTRSLMKIQNLYIRVY